MRIYRPQRRTADGQNVPYSRFYAELRTADGRIMRLPGFENQRLTESLGRNVQRLIDCRASGETLPQDTARWIETLPQHITAVLARWGLLQGHTLAAGKALSEHIADWKANLLARGNTQQHADLSARRVESVTQSCGFKFYGDISAAQVQQELAGRRKDTVDAAGNPVRGMGIKTSNYYLRDLKSFCRWMMHERRATSNPVAYLDTMNARADIRVQRRALSTADMQKLLDAARNGLERHGMTGSERALIYELAATTGLRVSELASLTAASFSLGESPSVNIQAAYAKNRRQDNLPLRADMAGLLRAFLAGKMPSAKAFPKLNNDCSADMLKADLEAAGLPYELDGKTFDFHALRHQFISSLAAAGVHPKTAQQLARHSTITLTMDNYTHVYRGELDKAVDALPDWHMPKPEQARATGTDNLPVNAVAEPTHRAIPESENRMARSGALLRDKPWRPVASSSVNAESGTSASNPLNMRESCDNQGNWARQDSNLRRHKPTDLQSVPFGRSGTRPFRDQ